jgi:hypothetical protein
MAAALEVEAVGEQAPASTPVSTQGLAVGVVAEAVSHRDPEVVALEVMEDMAMAAITEGFKVTGVVVPGMAVVGGDRTPAVLNINQPWELTRRAAISSFLIH